MKTFILFLVLLTIANVSLAQTNEVSNSTWIDTNYVLISNPQNPEIARRDCETTMRVLNIMSNDKIVFRSMCEPSYNPRCVYYYCYQLNVKALVINQRRHEQ